MAELKTMSLNNIALRVQRTKAEIFLFQRISEDPCEFIHLAFEDDGIHIPGSSSTLLQYNGFGMCLERLAFRLKLCQISTFSDIKLWRCGGTNERCGQRECECFVNVVWVPCECCVNT